MRATSEHRGSAMASVLRALSLIAQIGLSVLCPILLLILLGVWLDGKFGNGHHWFLFAGILIGIYSAYRGTWLLIRKNFLKEDGTGKDAGETGPGDGNG